MTIVIFIPAYLAIAVFVIVGAVAGNALMEDGDDPKLRKLLLILTIVMIVSVMVCTTFASIVSVDIVLAKVTPYITT